MTALGPGVVGEVQVVLQNLSNRHWVSMRILRKINHRRYSSSPLSSFNIYTMKSCSLRSAAYAVHSMQELMQERGRELTEPEPEPLYDA